jgi:CheY-like chemotaxis protein/anti-sigma regulatory factor (Ser/Thr protein kinase)
VVSGLHVLLVEDTPTTARATAALLTDGALAAKVVLVSDVESALEQLRTTEVDLVVLDLALPDRHGLDLLAEIRSNERWHLLPVVVLSGMSDPQDVQRSYDLGANCFVRKPHRIVELVPAVRAIEQFWARHVVMQTGAVHDNVFQLPLAATADAVREARATVRKVLDGWGLEDLEDTAELCAGELATNAVIHARSPVLMAMALLDDAVRFEVEDEAPGEIAAGTLVHDAETGRGLALVDELSESWGVEQHEGGKTVWFELRRPGT